MSQSGQSVDRERVEPATRLGDQLYHRLALLIERGEFAEGGRLPPESELAERFRVSRPVIREALSRLRSVGVIISRRGSGSFVQKRADRPAGPRSASSFGPITSLAEVRQCYAFRACVESEAAFHAAQNRSPEALGAMRDALDRIEVAIARGLVGMDADYEFHAGVAQASGNPFFEGVMEAMRTPIEFTIELARNLSMRRPLEHLLTVQAEHVAVFEAIQRGEPEPARAAMRLHVENSCHRVFEGPGGVAGR